MNLENAEKKIFQTHDGLKLSYKCYPAQKQEKAVLIFAHGVNEYMGRYQYAIDFFSKNYKIYIFDFRGHGFSEGIRSFVNSIDDLILDLKTFVDFVVAKERGKKFFLIAHSMGGQIALNYLGRYPQNGLAGFMTSSPNIQVAFHVSAFEKFLGRKLEKIFPKMPLLNQKIKPRHLTRIPESVEDYKTDKLVNKNMTLRLAVELFRNQEDGILMGMAEKIYLPAFMMHSGDDHVCDKQGSIDFFNKLSSSDKKLKIYDGAYHELFNDTVKDEVFQDMNRWLEDHL